MNAIFASICGRSLQTIGYIFIHTGQFSLVPRAFPATMLSNII